MRRLAIGLLSLSVVLPAYATQQVFLNFDEFPFFPSLTQQRFSDGLDGFTAAPFTNGFVDPGTALGIQILMLGFIAEDYQDFDIAFDTVRPAPPTTFVQWGMDDRAYTFARDCEDEDGDSDGDGNLECIIADNARLHGIACTPEAAAADTCQINTARTFAGSFSLTSSNQPYNGGNGDSLSNPPLTIGLLGSIEPIARALANSASHEIAHLFIGGIHTEADLSIMTASPEAIMATTDKIFVNDVLFQLCDILGPSGPASRCPPSSGNAAEMDSGSPTVLSQQIVPDFEFHEPAPQPVKFDYLFRTTTGRLTIGLNGVSLLVIDAPTSLTNSFTPVDLLVPFDLFDGQPGTLSLTLDETNPAEQARVVLRRVRASGFENGYFQTGDLSNWTVEASGAGGVRVIDPSIVTSPPTAVATATSPIAEGDIASLDGSGSFDPQGDTLSFVWQQIAGSPSVTLQNPASATPSFIAPAVPGNTTLTFQLRVDDGVDTSEPVTVDITIQNTNSPPVADAGDDFELKAGASGALDASNTFDPEGTPLTALALDWVQAAGPEVSLDTTDPIRPTFTVPVSIGETLTFKLTASDGFESSIPSSGLDSSNADTVAVTVTDNAAPIADAGPDLTKNEGTMVTLSASNSADPDGDQITFLWEQLGGTDVGVTGSTATTPMFMAPTVSAGGEALEFRVTVSDNDPFNQKMASDQVLVNVASINDPPSCHLAYASESVLWPPNHSLHEVSIEGVMDNDDVYNDIVLTIAGITQDEPTNATGDGDSSPDGVVQPNAGSATALLRAERAGNGNGRVYQVTFVASDGFEQCQGSVHVAVPIARKGDALDDGQQFQSN